MRSIAKSADHTGPVEMSEDRGALGQIRACGDKEDSHRLIKGLASTTVVPF